MAFAEQLLSWKSEDSEGKSEDEPDAIPTAVLLHVVELLGKQMSGRWRLVAQAAATCQSTSYESRLGSLDSSQWSAGCHHCTIWQQLPMKNNSIVML